MPCVCFLCGTRRKELPPPQWHAIQPLGLFELCTLLVFSIKFQSRFRHKGRATLGHSIVLSSQSPFPLGFIGFRLESSWAKYHRGTLDGPPAQ